MLEGKCVFVIPSFLWEFFVVVTEGLRVHVMFHAKGVSAEKNAKRLLLSYLF